MKLRDLLPFLHGFVDIFEFTTSGKTNVLRGKYDCYSLTSEKGNVLELLDAEVVYVASGENGKGIKVVVSFDGGDNE